MRYSTTLRNQTANQILDGNNSAKIVLSIHNSCQTKPCSAQLLHDSIGRLILRSRDNSPDIVAQRFVSVSVEQDIEDIDQPGRLAVGRKHRQTIKTSRSAKLQRLLLWTRPTVARRLSPKAA